MKTPEEIFDECLQARGIDRIGLQDAEVYEAGLDAIKQALAIPIVSQQRELLRSYNKFINEECLLGGGILSDFEIEKFEERNCG